ncbi:MAG: ATP cone domain-containing protein [bacterium]
MSPEIYIVKADGTRELFDRAKLEHSLRKIGTEQDVVSRIVSEITANLSDGSTTKEIYTKAFALLKKTQKTVALRYSLKKAVADLGPSGFPFEEYVAEIFKSLGYTTETDVIVMGKCVPHEMDVVAYNDTELIMIEAKFHTDFGAKSDLKVALYIKARFEDLAGNTFKFGGKERKLTKGMLITNTKFSSTAIQYGECNNLNMVGWNYPQGNNLHNLIEGHDLVPLTVLTSLTQSEKRMFIASNIVLSRQLGDYGLLKQFGISDAKAKIIIKEVYSLCKDCISIDELSKINT